MINHNNRPQICLPIAAISASVVLPALLADKKMRVLSAKYVQEGAISASGVNYLAMRLKVNNVLVGAAVDTQAGVTARTPVELDLGAELILAKDSYVALDVVETGTFAEGTQGLLVLDVEIIGN
jgi:hypothetical protein